MNNRIGNWMNEKKMSKMQEIGQDMDPEQTRQILNQVIEQKIAPALVEIRQRSEGQDDPEAVRKKLKAMDPEQQQQKFDAALNDLIEVVWTLRENPQKGVLMLKELLRDPWTFESLLLVFENAEHIDAEYSEDIKEMTGLYARMVGVALAPEMYDAETVKQIGQMIDVPVAERAANGE